MKKFEEGIFSDLRNLKPGVDASLEEPKVSFFFFLAVLVDFLCFRTTRRRDSWLSFLHLVTRPDVHLV